jgi:hypothetical protein
MLTLPRDMTRIASISIERKIYAISDSITMSIINRTISEHLAVGAGLEPARGS